MVSTIPLKQSPFPSFRSKPAAELALRGHPVCLKIACQVSQAIPGWTRARAALCLTQPEVFLPVGAMAGSDRDVDAEYVDLLFKPTQFIRELGQPAAMRV
jgi:hypothetical protein